MVGHMNVVEGVADAALLRHAKRIPLVTQPIPITPLLIAPPYLQFSPLNPSPAIP